MNARISSIAWFLLTTVRLFLRCKENCFGQLQYNTMSFIGDMEADRSRNCDYRT